MKLKKEIQAIKELNEQERQAQASKMQNSDSSESKWLAMRWWEKQKAINQ